MIVINSSNGGAYTPWEHMAWFCNRLMFTGNISNIFVVLIKSFLPMINALSSLYSQAGVESLQGMTCGLGSDPITTHKMIRLDQVATNYDITRYQPATGN